MANRSGYGAVAKMFHWLIAALMLVQFVIGILMPDIRRGMTPGTAMMAHVSFGMVILGVLVLRFLWRLTHPVAEEAGLPAWQSRSSALVHWGLYALVAIASVAGWYYVTLRGWTIPIFNTVQLPLLAEQGSPLARSLGRLHESLVWLLLAVIGLHVAAALLHHFYYRDGVLRRMMPAGK